jgi:hypothetical protein
LALDIKETATDEGQVLCDTFKLSWSTECIYVFKRDLTPHGGIWLNASVAESGAAFTVKLKALANSTSEIAQRQNMTGR